MANKVISKGMEIKKYAFHKDGAKTVCIMTVEYRLPLIQGCGYNLLQGIVSKIIKSYPSLYANENWFPPLKTIIVARATCSPEDTYNSDTGERIAYLRAKRKALIRHRQILSLYYNTLHKTLEEIRNAFIGLDNSHIKLTNAISKIYE